MHELFRMSIPSLLALRKKQGSLSGALEKTDLIQALIDEDLIDIIPSPEPVEYKLDALNKMSIGQLKRAMEEAGVFFQIGRAHV